MSTTPEEIRTLLGLGPENPGSDVPTEFGVRHDEISQLQDRLARIHEEETRELTVTEELGAASNRVFNATMGLPVDLTNLALTLVGQGQEDPALGSQHIARAMRSLGFSGAGSEGSLLGAGAEGVLSSITPFLGMLTAGKKIEAAGKLGDDILSQAAKRPVKTGVEETALGGAAVTGGQAAVNAGVVDEGGGRIGVEIGTSLGTGIVFNATRAAIEGVRRVVEPLTAGGQERRVAREIQNRASDTETAAAEITESVLRYGDADLSTPQLSGDIGLLALERSLVRDVDILPDDLSRESAISSLIKQQIQKMAGEGKTTAFVNRVRASAERGVALMNERLDLAISKAQSKIAELPPVAGRAQHSAVVFNEVSAAMNDARLHEKELWGLALGPGGRIPAQQIKDRLASIGKHALKADTPIPKKITKIIDDLADAESIEEIQQVRSRILLEMRKQKGKKAVDWRLVGKLDELQGSVLDSMDDAVGDAGVLDDARIFSREFNTKFTRGPVGKLLGYSSDGAPSIAPETMMRRLMSSREAGGGNIAAVIATLAGRPGGLKAAEDFIATEFLDVVADESLKVNPTKAARFLSQHSETLEQFPDLRERLKNIKSAEEAVDDVTFLRDRTKKDIENSSLSLFLNKSPAKAVQGIFNNENPLKALREIVDSVKDSPPALKGLRRAIGDNLDGKINLAQRNVEGDAPLVSPMKMRQTLERHGDIIKEVYGEDGLERWQLLTEIAERRNLTAGAKAKGGSDTMQNFAGQMMGRVIGAKLASLLPFGRGNIQTPGAGARAGQALLGDRGVAQMRAIMRMALEDPEVMKGLLLRVDARNANALRQIFTRKSQGFLSTFSGRDSEEE